MQRLRSYIPHALVSGIFILMLLIYCFKSSLMLQTTDFWWHIAAGDLIRKLHTLPASDPFSFTAGNYAWLNLSWLWDAFYSRLYERGGMYLPIIATAILHALVMALLVYFMLYHKAGIIIALLAFLFCFVPYSYMITPTPYQVTLLMTMVFYLLVHKAIAENRRKLLWILPVLMVAWANTHGGFFVGYMIIGAYTVEAMLRKNMHMMLALTLVLTACITATLVNPLGFGIFEACGRTLSSSLLPIISEWSPLQFTEKYFMYTGYVVLYLILFNLLNAKVSLAEKILSLLWAVAALKHERNLPLFVLLSAPALVLNLQYLVSYLPGRVQFLLSLKETEYEEDLNNKPVVKSFTFASAVALVLLLAAGAGKSFVDLKLSELHPVEEAEHIRDNYKDLRILNDYFQGGYLLHVLQNRSKIFIDGRAETAYPPEVVQDYLDFYSNRPGWEKMLDKYKINAALIPIADVNQSYFFKTSRQWHKMYEGKLDTLYIRKIQ